MKSRTGLAIAISVVAVILFTGIIIYLACFSDGSKNLKSASENEKAKVEQQLEVSSDAQAGENNSEIKNEITPSEISGKYIDDSDGWYHEFVYAPGEVYDGTFTTGFDPNHASTSPDAQVDATFSGGWKLENGEIKLFSDLGYLYSLFTCGEYLVDAKNYFVGEVPKEGEPFMSAFMCKAAESGDTQILSFYPDGKFILQIIRNDGAMDKAQTSDISADPSQTQPLPDTMSAGTYTVRDSKIIATLNGVSQEYYIVEDGLAKWIYHKE